jgi:hypothetical protein
MRVFVAVAIGLSAGLVAGFICGKRSSTPQPASSSGPGGEAAPMTPASTSPSAGSGATQDDDLNNARAEARELRAKLETLEEASRADIASRVAALRARIPGLIAEKKADELLELLKELDSLGEAAYPAMAELIDAFASHPADFMLRNLQFSQLLQGGIAKAFLQWSLLNHAATTDQGRLAIYQALMMRSFDGNNAFALRSLFEDQDTVSARMLAVLAGIKPTEAMIPDLAAAARRHSGDAGISGSLLRGLISMQTKTSNDALAALESDPALAEELRMIRMAQNPPADGLLVDGTPATTSLFRRGDIIVEVDGQPAKSSAETLQALSPREGTVSVTLFRDGQTLTLSAGAGEFRGFGFRQVVRKPK